MREFDLVVIGAGSGLRVAAAAAEKRLSVAVVEEGPMGGTCLNRGCIPSKMIIHSADVAETVGKAHLFGINTKGFSADFAKITARASDAVDKEAREIEKGIRSAENMELFRKRGRFVDERTIVVGNKKVRGGKVVVAAGTRPAVPEIDGIENIRYLTSDNVMRLTKQPKSMIILGGGFIATEMAHFFGSLGTEVTIVQRSVLLREHDREIAEAFTKIFGKKHRILLGYSPRSVKQVGGRTILEAESKKKTRKIEAESLLLAAGRIPNTDTLDARKGGIETDARGYIKVNEYLETTARNTWSLGDINGKYLLKHSANLEAQYVLNNALGKKRKKIDYWPMPHAIFTSPQIASVGRTEEELRQKGISYAKGKYLYSDTGMGLALGENEGFAKVLADRKTRKILGCHIMGPEAASVIHEIIVAMKLGATTDDMERVVHIHPAMSEVVQRAVLNIDWNKAKT